MFAQAADRPTRFIRAMILPAAYLGKSSAEYLREEDKPKPKVQQYKMFVDLPLAGDFVARMSASDMRGAVERPIPDVAPLIRATTEARHIGL